MDHFSFHSEQIHSMFKNGKGQTRRNTVSVKNGKGTKAVEFFTMDGKSLRRKEKTLSKSEIENIQMNKFIPKLFKDCTKSVKTRRLRPKQKDQRIRYK